MTALVLASPWAIPASAQDSSITRPADLVGAYDGGQTELAAGLELSADGRFRYALSYGALDEEAAGTWTIDRKRVLLTSDPVTPPRFVLVELRDAQSGRLAVTLDLPRGMSRQYFSAEIQRDDGTVIDRQLSDEGEPLELGSDERPTAVTLTLPMFGLRSETVLLRGAGGHDLRFRFEPHDLGKVAFSNTALRIEGAELLLLRHDREIRFRRMTKSGVASDR